MTEKLLYEASHQLVHSATLRAARMRQLSRELHPLRYAREDPGVRARPLRWRLNYHINLIWNL